MKLKDLTTWKAVHFGTATYLPKDLKLMSKEQKEILLNAEVKPRRAYGHYEVTRL